jgi:site-specific recombinase XerD
VLRHTSCKQLADVAVIRTLASHADIRTMTIYTAVSNDRLEHAIAERTITHGSPVERGLRASYGRP